jgi:hypothetical protein
MTRVVLHRTESGRYHTDDGYNVYRLIDWDHIVKGRRRGRNITRFAGWQVYRPDGSLLDEAAINLDAVRYTILLDREDKT